MDQKLGKPKYTSQELITYVKDRAGHDFRYAIDNRKLIQLGWKPKYNFETGIVQTIDWYMDNKGWTMRIRSGDYRKYKF